MDPTQPGNSGKKQMGYRVIRRASVFVAGAALVVTGIVLLFLPGPGLLLLVAGLALLGTEFPWAARTLKQMKARGHKVLGTFRKNG